MRSWKLGALGLAASLLASFTSAQGLADAAKKEKDRRKQAAPASSPAKTYTEADISGGSTAAAPSGDASPAPPSPSSRSASASAGNPTGSVARRSGGPDGGEAGWRQAAQAARARIADAEARVRDLEVRINDARLVYGVKSSGCNGGAEIVQSHGAKAACLLYTSPSPRD